MGGKSLGLLCVTSMGAVGAERLRFLSEDMAEGGKLCAGDAGVREVLRKILGGG